MKVIDILKNATILLGLDNEKSILDSTTEDAQTSANENENIKKLFNLFKFSIQEFCSNYTPISNTTTISSNGKKIAMSSILNCLQVQNVLQNGINVEYKIINRNIVLDDDGEFEIKYLTYPTLNSLFDEIDFLKDLSPDVLTFGLCAYYSLAVGMFDEFNRFHEEYIKKAEGVKSLKIFDMPLRRWE